MVTHAGRQLLKTNPSLIQTAPPAVRCRPLTPGTRHKVILDRTALYKGPPVKKLTVPLKSRAGRNNTGQIVVRHRGGGLKRRFRIVDFRRSLQGVPAVLRRIEYDPNRSSFLALLAYQNGAIAYTLCPQGLKVGDEVIAGEDVDIKPGNALPLKGIPIGTLVHNIELAPGRGGMMCRSAGTSAQVLDKTMDGFALLRLPSKETRKVAMNCMATVGEVSNPHHKDEKVGKAGRNRLKGWRPRVRGYAMNPADHPMGGRTKGGKGIVSYSGKVYKGKRTRDKHKASNKYIECTRHKGRGRPG